jgi:hypothetical protein
MVLSTTPACTGNLVFAVRRRRISATSIVSQEASTDGPDCTNPMQANGQEQLVSKSGAIHLRASRTHEVHARTSMPLVRCTALSRTLKHLKRRKRQTRAKCLVIEDRSRDSQRPTNLTQAFSI